MVEICITRITTAIRETASIEKHAKALVGLWDSCLEHSLRPSGKDDDAPHAKIASDILSCILQVCQRSSSRRLIRAVRLRCTHGVSEPRANVSLAFQSCKKIPQTINSQAPRGPRKPLLSARHTGGIQSNTSASSNLFGELRHVCIKT